jgi:Fe-S-cluster containining protein
MTRDQRRAALKDILKDYDRGGFNPQRMFTVFGLVRDLVDILKDTRNAKRMSDSGALVMKAYDACAKVHGRPQEVACKKGCGYCCHTRVTVTVPEIFLLARTIRTRWEDAEDPWKARFQAQEARTRGLDIAQRYATRTACPILSDEGSCSMYEPRPLTCRAYASKSLPACIELYNQISHNIPQSDINQLMRTFIYAGLKAALSEAGFDTKAYELGHAVDVALTRGAEGRWLAGEALFADVAPEVSLPRNAGHDAFDMLVGVLKAGAFGKDIPPNPWFQWPN